MSDKTSEQDASAWKQKYYDNLDQLDKNKNDWQTLESILKKTVLRLSIAAEGTHASLDRHLHDIRSMVKDQVNIMRLENTLDDFSSLLLKLEDNKASPDRKVVSMLTGLLENITFPDALNKKKNKLIKKLSKASDKGSDDLVKEIQNLLSGSISQNTNGSDEKPRSGFLSKLLGSSDNNSNKTHDDSVAEDEAVINIDTDDSYPIKPKIADQPGTPDIKADLRPDLKSDLTASSQSAEPSEPTVSDILLRLLEQLTVPSDLHEDVESLKHRIENKSSVTSWKQLLKDITALINALRHRIQEEKQEFETFLQQITSRLQEMDNFLSIETASIIEAEHASENFDVVVSAQVKDIHADMNAADDLSDLKSKVEKRLNVVSEHIKEYRINEQERYSSAQQNVESMQSRLLQLEQESSNLRQLMIEKSKEAMTDALTKIPNRLAYEKQAREEIARCKRFATPLSMAVWDVDLFKQVNDTYGHKLGDKVLMAVAQILSERMRETDFIARYGGEEFVMFLPGANEEEALLLADALREKIAAYKFKNNDEVIRISMSCGISSFVKNDSHESMFERADKALYCAKDKGRNQCVTSSSSLNKI